jgi:hypothetical protein
MTLLATITPSASHNPNLSLNLPPSWLVETHSKLWGQRDFFGKIFRTATLTKDHFIELQCLLDARNPERISESYVAKNVLATKSAFLRIKSTPLSTDFGNDLAPRLVFDASSDAVANDDAVADDAMDTDPDHSSSDHVDPHMAHLSNEAKAIFPYTIRYVDLTVLKLKGDLRVPQLILFRNEWGTMIDIFNKSEKGRQGSAVFTGQPGIGEHYYWYLTVTSNQQTRENMPAVFHPYPLHHSRPVNCVPGYVRQDLHH